MTQEFDCNDKLNHIEQNQGGRASEGGGLTTLIGVFKMHAEYFKSPNLH